MKTIVMLFASILIALASAGSQAQNYYICDTGDDNNDGKSETTPFRSYEKAMDTFNSMSGGDAVLFCRGGVFPTSTDKRLYNSRCSADNACTIGDYGDPILERPMLAPSNVTALNFLNGGDAVADGGYVIKNLILRAVNEGSGSGVSFYNDVDDVTLLNLHIEGFNVGVYSAGANSPSTGSNQANDRIILKDSVVMNNSNQGWLGGCNDCLIEGNYFENNGYGGPTSHHTIYISSPVKRQDFVISNMTVRGNTLYKSTNVDGKCSGASFVVHGIIENLTIQNNVIKEDVGAVTTGCWGISIDPGNSLDESFTNVLISNNSLWNVGNNAIGCASCDGLTIENNKIIDQANVLKSAIKIPVKPEDSVKSKNVVINNNTVIVSRDDAVGVSIGGEHVFSVTGNEISLPETTTKDCFEKYDANESTDTSNNICQLYNELNLSSDDTTGTIEDVTYESDSTDTTTTDTTTTDTTTTDTTTTDTTTTDTTTTADTSTDTTTTDTTTTDTTTTADTSSTDTGYLNCRAKNNPKCQL